MRLKRVIAIFICLFFLGGSVFALSLPTGVGNYFIGYPSGLEAYMKKFNMSITDVRNYSKDSITQIKSAGTKVIGYVSVGEEVVLEKGDGLGPGGYASWYFDANSDGRPDQNGEFASYYTNAANSGWVQAILNRDIPEVLAKGVDGIFLDTVDTIEKYPQSRDGMVNLIKSIRQKYPSLIIIQNWGFNIAEQTAPYINAVMWESWYPDSNDQWVLNWQNKFKELKAKYGLDLITLGYYEKYSDINRYYEASKALGFIPFVDSSQNRSLVVDFFSARQVNINSAPVTTPTLPPTTTTPTETIQKPSVYLMAFMEPYKKVGNAMLVGPISWIKGWSIVRSYYGMLHREARGWDAGVEFSIPDLSKNAEIGVNYLDKGAGTLLGLSYYKWDSIAKKPVWSTTAVKKLGTGYVKGYKFVIPKEAFVDNNPVMPGMQVIVGIGGLCPVDKIKSVTFRQL
ncbi:MAG: endo alpha-1,4 polygalactosaminidase [Deltaproteobacteria bacterium]